MRGLVVGPKFKWILRLALNVFSLMYQAFLETARVTTIHELGARREIPGQRALTIG